MRKSKLTKYAREDMINQLGVMILKCTPRPKLVEYLVEKYNYSPKTTADIICEAQKSVAKSFTTEEVDVARVQIKTLCENIIFDEDEIGLSKLRAGELLMKLMKLNNPDVQVNNNTQINLSGYSVEELKQLLDD